MHFENYKKYRWFFTSSGKIVVGGKSAAQNDELLSGLKSEKKDFIVMHTSSPGSPFAIILSEKKSVTVSELEETAIFTASFSRAWRIEKKTESVDIFSLSQLSKFSAMKSGTWGISGKIEKKSVPLKLVLAVQDGTLRAVPERAVNSSEILLRVFPGKIDKTKMAQKIQKSLKGAFTQVEIIAALPPGGVSIK